VVLVGAEGKDIWAAVSPGVTSIGSVNDSRSSIVQFDGYGAVGTHGLSVAFYTCDCRANELVSRTGVICFYGRPSIAGCPGCLLPVTAAGRLTPETNGVKVGTPGSGGHQCRC
jgi:hypothetical protein